MATELNIKDGPTKPDLELGLCLERHLTLTFATDGDRSDGTEFELKGHVISGPHGNKAFTALYDALKPIQVRSS